MTASSPAANPFGRPASANARTCDARDADAATTSETTPARMQEDDVLRQAHVDRRGRRCARCHVGSVDFAGPLRRLLAHGYSMSFESVMCGMMMSRRSDRCLDGVAGS